MSISPRLPAPILKYLTDATQFMWETRSGSPFKLLLWILNRIPSLSMSSKAPPISASRLYRRTQGLSELPGSSPAALDFQTGLQHLPGEQAVFKYALTYNDHEDSQRYLVDLSGSKFGLMFRANWLF